MSKARVTIKEVAAKANVSLGTVHRALCGKKGVSEAVRSDILRIADEIGYEVNTAASLLKRKSLRIAVAFPGITPRNRYYYTDVWQGFRDYIAQVKDYNLQIIEVPFYSGTEQNQANALHSTLHHLQGELDGLLTVGLSQSTRSSKEENEQLLAAIAAFEARGIPIVLACNDIANCARLACVQVNYKEVGRVAAELLAAQTPENTSVLVCAGDRLIESHYKIVEGFTQYLAETKTPLKCSMIYDSDADQFAESIKAALTKDDHIFAAFSVNAQGSVALAEALRELQLTRRIRAVGSDVFAENIAAMQEGILCNLLDKKQRKQAFIATQVLLDAIVRDIKPQKSTVYVNSNVVFRSNLRQNR